MSTDFYKQIDLQGGPKKGSHYQMIKKWFNRIKACNWD